MKRILLAAIAVIIIASPAMADDLDDYQSAQAASYRDSGVGSYSNVYGHGWTKVCCDYPYYHPSRANRGRRRR